MLVLTRRAGERILIGDDIVVTILETRGDAVRIGIDAPRGVRIQRDEIVQAVSAANQDAMQSSLDAEEAERLLKKSLG
ncbi:carbon storage regulator CsrA [Curtobacterium ammoniigenes]|uniref:carbon storage regulator CsrA n=1 Tax=Curtobacterium ammoniigenes TaxID=395387 RepID=UPI00082DC6A8|nr:carbon storage regulator CsrA [Curtobacterium ammoniigenes]